MPHLTGSLGRNCVYLTGDEEQPLVFRGLRIWGSPVTVARKRKMSTRAFERTDQQREALWDSVPEDLDVLALHVPVWLKGMSHPRTVWKGAHVDDALLSARLDQMASSAPRVVCFGHWHDDLGFFTNGETLLCAAAQELVIEHEERYGLEGGVPLVFDLCARDE